MGVERPRNGHVRLNVGETGLLQGAVGSHIERIGFAEELLQLQDPEIEFSSLSNTLHADPLPAQRRIGDVEMHIRLLAKADLVGGREPQDLVVGEPDHQKVASLLDGVGRTIARKVAAIVKRAVVAWDRPPALPGDPASLSGNTQ